MRIVTATAVILTLAAGAAPAAVADTGRAGTDGLWRMGGYGTVLALGHGVYQEYQTTAVSCLKGDSARQTDPGRYTADDTVLTVRLGRDHDHARLSADSSVGHRQLRRIAALPGMCTRPSAGDPRTAFDVFWRSFEENYPFFAAKGIDWHAVRDRYRPLIHKDTTRSELFDVFSRMVAPLHDAHVAVQDGDRVFAQGRPGTEVPSEQLDARVKKFIGRRDLARAPYRRDFAAGRITYADLPEGGPGYLRVSGFGGYTTADHDSYAADLAELDKALDTVLTAERTRRLPGLIIDLRINGGGSDALGIHLAGRLTDRPYVAYAKRARNDPADPTRHTRADTGASRPRAPLHRPRRRPDRRVHGQRGRDLHSGPHGPPPQDDPHRTTHPGRLLRRHVPQAPERHDRLAPQRGVPHPHGPHLRRHRHTAADHRAGLHEEGVRREP